MQSRIILVVILGAMLAVGTAFIVPSCFNPDYPAEVKCGPNDFCPDEQFCLDGVCRRKGPQCSDGRFCPEGMNCAAYEDTCISDGCGDAFLDRSAGEVCDDGNTISGDGCSADCSRIEIEPGVPTMDGGGCRSSEVVFEDGFNGASPDWDRHSFGVEIDESMVEWDLSGEETRFLTHLVPEISGDFELAFDVRYRDNTDDCSLIVGIGSDVNPAANIFPVGTQAEIGSIGVGCSNAFYFVATITEDANQTTQTSRYNFACNDSMGTGFIQIARNDWYRVVLSRTAGRVRTDVLIDGMSLLAAVGTTEIVPAASLGRLDTIFIGSHATGNPSTCRGELDDLVLREFENCD